MDRDPEDKDHPRANRCEPLAVSLERLNKKRLEWQAEQAKNPPPAQPMGVVRYEVPPPKVTITKKDLARHLVALGVVYPPRNSMTEEELTMRFQLFFDALRGLSEGELAMACKRYWNNPANAFFPHPGALLALAKY